MMTTVLTATALVLAATPVENRPTLHVTGAASVTFPADEAKVRITVWAMEPTRTAAREAADARLRAVLEVLRSQGMKDAHFVVTEDRGTYPLYLDREVVGQSVSHSIELSMFDLKKLDALLTACVRAGALPQVRITFSSSRVDEWKTKLVTAAASDARHKAQAMVDKLGGRLGPPRTVLDLRGWNWSQVGDRTVVAAQDGSVVSNSTSQEITLRGELSVQFDLR